MVATRGWLLFRLIANDEAAGPEHTPQSSILGLLSVTPVLLVLCRIANGSNVTEQGSADVKRGAGVRRASLPLLQLVPP
ncbi:unnamed protein product [Rangifer tarandus platyrhynchus]|uniref:Uncharacterized protein n=1 Tax=Rangifer tarandus platyrhynchus TaxID=3082113 RepID=A0ABN8XNC6_RANTA|nr:unnamed protein product [Rangifer tarandus platyrhynchus]